LAWLEKGDTAVLRNHLALLLLLTAIIGSPVQSSVAAEAVVSIDTPTPPPDWAVQERELLRANAAACRVFFDRYFDERGYLQCVERWGGDDGPDDAIENCIYWPILHALGADDSVLAMYKKAWEGHLRQYTEAKTVEVPFARDGMYYKEFPVMFDWLHNSEGLTVFNLQGLSDPDDVQFGHRVRRYAGFYMNEDPQALNYDPKHNIIRSLFNGSRGPLLRKATALDWTGDPIEVANRFSLGHGETSYEEMLAHFKDYNDIVGDHPSNLKATCLALNAYMLTHEPKYKQWLLKYVDGWNRRIAANGNVIPSNVGLDGKIGSATDGKWYGGTYGWGFSVVVPQTGKLAHRNTTNLGISGFVNAYMLTGDDRYLDGWRKQIATINAQKKTVDGRTLYPHNFGDNGWYNFQSQPYTVGALEIYYLSMKPSDRKWVPSNAWLAYLDGRNPNYPQTALRGDFARIRQRVAGIRNDTTTPDTRLADDPMKFNPASIQSLVHLMTGGLYSGKNGLIHQCRLRYFDPKRQRAGIAEDVAALIEKMTDDSTTVALVNVNQLDARTVVLQGGAYAEHQILSATLNGKTIDVDDSSLTVKLQPGSGNRLVLKMKRYANQPTLAFPWNR
jgi:hypothetical protein